MPDDAADTADALVGYARASAAIADEMTRMNARQRYRKSQLLETDHTFAPLVEGEPERGFVGLEKPASFAWSIHAVSGGTMVSGVSLLDTLRRCADDIAVLKIVDRPIEDNISTIRLCAGQDGRGHLVGFAIREVRT